MFLDLEPILARALPVGLRTAGLMSFSPFLGSESIPVRLRAVFTIALTALLYPVSPVPSIAPTLAGWTSVAFSEVILGLGMGLCMQLVLEAAILAGQLAGFQFAFSLVNVIDPQTNVDTPVLSTFHQLFALLIFLQLDIHHWVLRGIARSFRYAPVGTLHFSMDAAKAVFQAAGGMWLAGLQIALPLLLATLLIDSTVGFLSKASPQLPALFLSIPLKSLAGYSVLALTVGFWPGIFEKLFLRSLGWSEQVLRLAQ